MLDFLEKSIRQLLDEYGYTLNEHEYMKIMYYIFRDFVGLNEIEPLLRDPYIEDIGLDGIGIPVYIVHQKFGSIRTNIIYKSEEHLREFVTKISERCDRYISYAEPLLDGTLPDGTRIQASLASYVTARGPTFSIRKFREVPFSPIDMLRLGTVSPEMLAYIWFVIENGANIMIAGGVATGKTSMLNSLSLFIPHEANIVSIEDTRELNLMHENWIPGVARAGFTGSGVGEVAGGVVGGGGGGAGGAGGVVGGAGGDAPGRVGAHALASWCVGQRVPEAMGRSHTSHVSTQSSQRSSAPSTRCESG